MIQFTIGCILLALTLFFGGKDLLANNDVIANLEKSVSRAESQLQRAQNVKRRFEAAKEDAIVSSTEVKQNLINQLNINEDKYDFKFTEAADNNKILVTNTYVIEGYNSFADIFTLVSDIEKIKGLEIDNVCFNCKVSNEELRKGLNEVGFKIEGKAYVYNEK